jgi:hypothetical protein
MKLNFAHNFLGKKPLQRQTNIIISTTCEAIIWESQKISLQVPVKLCRRARIPSKREL